VNDTPETPGGRHQSQEHEPLDSRYHDDDDIVPVDDLPHRRTDPAAKRKPSRRLPPMRRTYPDDD
jgi:hypothetical protein